ncbi:MAG: hypothetical protein JKY55_14005 [Aliivibrio sp.]|uniref:hypothetical protein n=1 Tax=Aliivibrio sp. TaxID=1872443 RepID=UPI001A4F4BCC|nr:hypothetical protein [Aliivibrio sp.]
MTIRNMEEVEARLEQAVVMLKVDDILSPQEYYDLHEQAAIAMLDSEFDDFPEGELESYLMAYLERKRGELG